MLKGLKRAVSLVATLSMLLAPYQAVMAEPNTRISWAMEDKTLPNQNCQFLKNGSVSSTVDYKTGIYGKGSNDTSMEIGAYSKASRLDIRAAGSVNYSDEGYGEGTTVYCSTDFAFETQGQLPTLQIAGSPNASGNGDTNFYADAANLKIALDNLPELEAQKWHKLAVAVKLNGNTAGTANDVTIWVDGIKAGSGKITAPKAVTLVWTLFRITNPSTDGKNTMYLDNIVAQIYPSGETPDITYTPEPEEIELLGCEEFESSSSLSKFITAGGPTVDIVPNPDTSIGGNVLRHYNESTSASWVKNVPAIVLPGSSGTYEVGTDLYIPSSFNDSEGNIITFVINDNNNYRIRFVSDKYDQTSGTIQGYLAVAPYDTWLRLVYEFNFATGKYSAYLMKNGKVYTKIVNNANIETGVIQNGISTMRMHLQGAGQMIYADNYGIKPQSFEIYDFEDGQWSGELETAGSATWSVASDPQNAGHGNVLQYTHKDGQANSWIRNYETLGSYTTGKWEVGADLYIPDTALSQVGSNIRFTVNGDSSHRLELIPEDISETDLQNNVYDTYTTRSPIRTTNFPRNKWIRVRFVFDLDKGVYNAEIVSDGKVITRQFKDRDCASIVANGISKLQLYIAGKDQTVYVDNFGISEFVGENQEKVPSVKFIRVDGLNMAGEELSIYGDFADGATANDLTDIVWAKCDTQYGEYERIPEADNAVSYTPKDGGYFIQVTAKHGVTNLKTIPLYIRPAASKITLNPYLTSDDGKFTATVVYRNEGEEKTADAVVAVYENGVLDNVKIKPISVPNGNDIVNAQFNAPADMNGKTAKLFILDGIDNMYPLCSAVGLTDSYPTVDITTASSGSKITLNGEDLAVFKENRHMYMRATTDNDHWLGTEHNPTDIGFGYKDKGIAGFDCQDVSYEVYPGVFKIAFEGTKPVSDALETVEFIGFWNEEKQAFDYIRNSSLTAKTDTWHEKSTWAWHNELELFDFHVGRMSILDRVYNNNQNGDLYDYVVYSDSDSEVTKIPKLPVANTMLPGTYFCDFYISPGGRYYLADQTEGGWEATLLSDTGDTHINICWSWYDIHNTLRHMVPQTGSDEYFTAAQSWYYTVTDASSDAGIIAKAKEIDYKDLPNYQLPAFSKTNTFDRQFGGTDWEYAWWKSSYNCVMDSSIGHSDTSSVKITNTAKTVTSWYTDGVIGFPYSFDDMVGKTYKMSGWIKTENVSGEAYIAVVQDSSAAPNDNSVKSQTVTGTNDWTYVELEFVSKQTKDATGTSICADHYFLTLNGTGTVWFDDVVIEPVE